MRFLIAWLLEQRSTVAGTLACILFAITLIMRYGFDLWWPAGIGLAAAFAVVAIIGAGRE
jgi:hypothetical protein